MKEATDTTVLSQETPEKRLTRRDALKVLAALTGTATLASLPAHWKTPLVEVGALPAHAQTSATHIYFLDQEISEMAEFNGPSAIKVIVNGAAGIAYVEANNRQRHVRLRINLNIDGTPSDLFDIIDVGAGCEEKKPGASWKIVGYNLGDSTIKITSEGEGSWTVSVPLGTDTDTLPPLIACLA